VKGHEGEVFSVVTAQREKGDLKKNKGVRRDEGNEGGASSIPKARLNALLWNL